MSEQKIDRTFNKALEEVAKLEKAFKPGGKLDKAIMDMGGDPTALREAADTFKALNSGLTKAHFEALGQKEQLTEGVLDEDDEDGFMARSQLYFMAKDAIRLHSMINDKDNLEPWVQSKIAQAAQAMDAVRRYTEYNAMKAQVEPEMEPAMGPEITEQKEFGMFSPEGDAQVGNIVQYTLNDFEDAVEKANSSSERDMLRMQAMKKLFDELEEMSEQGYEEATDTDVRERAAMYLDSGIIRILDRLDDLDESKSEGDAWYIEQDAKRMAEKDGHDWSSLPYGRKRVYRSKAAEMRKGDDEDDMYESGEKTKESLEENMWGQGTLQGDAPHSQFMRSANADAARQRHMKGAKRKDRLAQKHAPKPGDFHSGVPSRGLITRPTESVEEGTEFDAAGQAAEFKSVATDVVKNALAKAKSKVKS